MQCDPQRTVPRRAWVRCPVAGAVGAAVMGRTGVFGAAVMAMAGLVGLAAAADGAAGAGSSGGVASPAQVPATIAVTPAGPLTTLGLGDQVVTCVQSPLAVDAAGQAGVLAPQLGVTIIRGSAAPSPGLSWVVVPVGRLPGGGTTLVTICTPAR